MCTLSALCGCAVCVFIIYCVCCVATAAVSSQPQHQHCLPLVLGQSERRKRATDQSQPGIYRQLLYTQHSGVVTFTHYNVIQHNLKSKFLYLFLEYRTLMIMFNLSIFQRDSLCLRQDVSPVRPLRHESRCPGGGRAQWLSPAPRSAQGCGHHCHRPGPASRPLRHALFLPRSACGPGRLTVT